MAAGYFVRKNKAGPFYFYLRAGNNEIIATSEPYTTKASALNGIDAVKANASAPVHDLTAQPSTK